jgi:hypothetical protein
MNNNTISNPNFIFMNRQTYTNSEFEEKFRFKKLESDNLIKNAANFCRKNYKPSPSCMKNFVRDRIPVIKWMINYNFKENMIPDTISGITIGLIHLPQGQIKFLENIL